MLSLYNPPEPKNMRQWNVNGFPATITIWTAEEFKKLVTKPPDAQPYPNGIWVTFRID